MVLSPEQVMVVCTDAAIKAVTSASEINALLRCGYWQARCNGTSATNQFNGAWDYRDTSQDKLNVVVQYNTTGTSTDNNPKGNLRIPAMISQAVKAWWRTSTGV